MARNNEPNRVLDVLIIGAGFSGICAGIKLLQKGIANFHIYEKSCGIGGCWWESRYPGAACDVPSHLYCFSFEPNAEFSRVFAPQREIQQYLEMCLNKYGLKPHLSNEMRVTKMNFHDDTGLWRISFADGSEVSAKNIINGTGALHEPLYPDISGVDSFTGKAMHSATWDDNFNYSGKRIAVIGSAASAIQIIPEIARSAARVDVYQRTPNWIMPRLDRQYKKWEKTLFRKTRLFLKLHRWWHLWRMELLIFPVTRKTSLLRSIYQWALKKRIRHHIKDPAMAALLTPDYNMGCKRILISDEFYPTLNRENVELITAPIEDISETGIRTNDCTSREVDAIVYATGYNVDAHFTRNFELTGRNGRDLADVWSDIPEAYWGCCVEEMPNYYMTAGPNSNGGNTSYVFIIEHLMDYIVESISNFGLRNTVTIKSEALRAHNEQLQKHMQNTVFLTGCRKNWYQTEDGRIVALNPYNIVLKLSKILPIKVEEFSIEPR